MLILRAIFTEEKIRLLLHFNEIIIKESLAVSLWWNVTINFSDGLELSLISRRKQTEELEMEFVEKRRASQARNVTKQGEQSHV